MSRSKVTPFRKWLVTRYAVAASFEKQNTKPPASEGREARAQWAEARDAELVEWMKANPRPPRSPEEQAEADALRKVHDELVGGLK